MRISGGHADALGPSDISYTRETERHLVLVQICISLCALFFALPPSEEAFHQIPPLEHLTVLLPPCLQVAPASLRPSMFCADVLPARLLRCPGCPNEVAQTAFSQIGMDS